jgi:hypothetical protein
MSDHERLKEQADKLADAILDRAAAAIENTDALGAVEALREVVIALCEQLVCHTHDGSLLPEFGTGGPLFPATKDERS